MPTIYLLNTHLDTLSFVIPPSIKIKTLNTLPNIGFYLCYQNHQLSLHNAHSALTLTVDFSSPDIQNRIKPSSTKLDLVKAVEGKNKHRLKILDMTAGLGQDSFCLAARGHMLNSIERNPYVYLLLCDGLKRARDTLQLQEIAQRITPHFADSTAFPFKDVVHNFDVVYLDPMFPERSKSAKVKKNMQLLHQLVGIDEQNNQALFHQTHSWQAKKIVVKRPRLGNFLSEKMPSSQIIGKSSRFDIYVTSSL